MKQYIDKSALAAEIEKKRNDYINSLMTEQVHVLNDVLDSLDTLEVEEVDLEKEINEIDNEWFDNDYGQIQLLKGTITMQVSNVKEVAKHFFNLGARASNSLTWEDMMIIHRCIKDAMNYHLYKMMEGVEGQKVVYQEVLKRFKESKIK